MKEGVMAFVALVLLPSFAFAQQAPNVPHLGYAYPAGGQQGTDVEMKLGGRFLDNASTVVVSGHGVHAAIVSLDKPATGQQLTDLRDKMQELQKRAGQPGVQQQMVELRARIGDSVRRNQNPGLSEMLALRVSIDADAEPGLRQVRVHTPLGLTNPVFIVVGQLAEFREKDEKRSPADSELTIPLPATVNGRLIPGDINRLQFPLRQAQQYAPGDADRYRFHATRGQHLVIVACARALMPYLADAVPGWIQATLTLFDEHGREVAYNDDYRFDPDPVIHYDVPADGDYIVEIKDALYRGREDFVYRISIGELPFITAMFPLGGPAGRKTDVEIGGWNLPTAKVSLKEKGPDGTVHLVSVKAGRLVSNTVPFAIDSLPEVTEREPNDTAKLAQHVTLPVIVNGRIQQPGDADIFAITARGGEDIVAEVLARRLGSPLDSVLELTDANGHRLAFNDDCDDKAAALVTHQADSYLTMKLPAKGTYYLRIGDRQQKGGAEYGYRLRISAPRPDFELRVAPAEINAVGNAPAPVTVYAIRRDGFAGDIALALKGGPSGSAISGGVIPAGQPQVRATITLPPSGAKEPARIDIEGRAMIGGRTVAHDATPADDMMQAFAYRHLVAADDLRAAVLGRGGTRVPPVVDTPQPIVLPAGGRAIVEVTLPPGYRTLENIRFELSEPPEGVTIREASVSPLPGPFRAQFVIEADASHAAAGARGNLIVNITGERVVPAGRGATPQPAAARAGNAQNGTQAAGTSASASQPAAATRRRVTIGALPAITFQVVKR